MMQLHRRFPLFLSILLLVSFPFILQSQTSESIPVVDRASRYPLTLENDDTEIVLQNLKPGENYEVFLSNDNLNCEAFFVFPQMRNDHVLKFKATEEEAVFLINKLCASPIEVYISTICTSCNNYTVQSMAGMTVDENYTPNQLVEDIFIGGDCFQLGEQSITFSGDNLSSGYFSNGNTSINIEDGVILSTGDIHNSAGPNDLYNSGNSFGTFGIDPDLSQMVNNTELYDIAALEFDFTPSTDMVSFEFVFASEEYCEYVNSPFNDVFGFFISGPGINGPFSNNAENIAVVPNTTDYTAINSVNHLANPAYYVNNIPSAQHPDIPPVLQCAGYPVAEDGAAIGDLEFDGFTTVMTAMANVQACETYHIKLIIADVGDGFFDSAVFLKANSFSAGEVTEVTAEVPGTDSTSNVVYEGCLDGNFVFKREEDDLSQPLVVHYNLSPMSTATAGIDYETLPDSIIIPAGDSVFYLPVISLNDALTEGTETIILELESFCSCEAPFVQMNIEDVIPLELIMDDLAICSFDSLTLEAPVTGGSGTYTYLWNTGTTTPTIDVFINADISYSVTVTDACGETVEDEMIIEATNIVIDFVTTEESCPGAADGVIVVSANGGTEPYGYIWSDGLPHHDHPDQLEAGVYELTLTDINGCSVTTEIEVPLNPNIPEADAGPNETLDCNITSLTLTGTASFGSNYTYLWTTNDGNIVSDENTLTPMVNQPGLYFLNVTDANTGCIVVDKTEVFINIIAPTAEASVIGPLILDCTNPTTTLDASASQPFGNLEYLWTTADGNIMYGETTINPEVDAAGEYVLTVTSLNNGCTDTDNILIGAHQLFPQLIIEPVGNLNCEDSTLTIEAGSSSFGTDFEITWTTNDGNFLSGTDSLFPIIDQGGTYYLTILNITNDCQKMDSIVVVEDRTPPIADAGIATELDCSEETVVLDGTASSAGLPYAYLWTTNNGNILNGENNLNPEVSMAGVYTLLVTNVFNACTAEDVVEVLEDTNQPNSADIEVIFPECFGDRGAVAIPTVYGGTEPYVYSIDGGLNFYNENVFQNLPFGNIALIIQDAEGCTYEEEIFMPEVPELLVELIPEVVIELGDSYEIETIVNIPELEIDSILWTPDEFLTCNNCLNPIASPTETTSYTVFLTNQNGCPAEAEILLRVDKDRKVYIPNVFSPNADGVNDEFLIFAKEGVITNISRFQIFNRWGGKIFEVKDALPNDPTFGWDGRMKGEKVNPAVFVYVAEIEFIDGRKIIYKGDVTVSR